MSLFVSDALAVDFDVNDSRHSSFDLILGAFFSRSVLTPRRLQTVTGFWEELTFYYILNNGSGGALHYVTAACAAAAYGVRRDSEAALDNARHLYNTAIARLSIDLESCATSTALATTILSVILCGFYEFIMCLKEDRSFVRVHEQGLIDILRSSAIQSFSRGPEDDRVFAAARHYLANDCLESGKSASDTLGSSTFSLNLSQSDFGGLLTRSVTRTADLIAAYRNSSHFRTDDDLLQVLERAQDIDTDLQRWTRRIPHHWSFTKRTHSFWSESYAYEGRCDTYYDLQVAANWNCYRRARLALLECIVDMIRALGKSRNDSTTLEGASLSTINTLCDDLCGSVPFHLGTRAPTSGIIEFPQLNDQEGDAIHRQMAPIHGWFFIVLPLSRLVNSKFISERQHAWAKFQYERICAIVGNKNRIPVDNVARILCTAVPAFASVLPINSRHISTKREVLTHENRQTRMGDGMNQGRDCMLSSANTSASLREKLQPQCWEHSCGGRRFANWSNLQRHRKERLAARWTCRTCNSHFTRQSARDSHIARSRCGSRFGRPRTRSQYP